MIASGQANINYSTIASNYSAFQAGGIANLGNAQVTLSSTIIANNFANNAGNNATWGKITQNCFKTPMIDNSNNLQFPAPVGGDIACVSGILAGDPKLGSLANNGGPTQTVPLLAGSAAIDKGSRDYCPAMDQRGLPRLKGNGCDIGAFEAQ